MTYNKMYRVSVTETRTIDFPVLSDSAEEAKAHVERIYKDGCIKLDEDTINKSKIIVCNN